MFCAKIQQVFFLKPRVSVILFALSLLCSCCSSNPGRGNPRSYWASGWRCITSSPPASSGKAQRQRGMSAFLVRCRLALASSRCSPLQPRAAPLPAAGCLSEAGGAQCCSAGYSLRIRCRRATLPGAQTMQERLLPQ